MLRLAHISDPHLGPLPETDGASLRLKQRLGRLNWRRARARAFSDDVLDGVLADLAAARPDHIAVTGDLINIGLDEEIRRAGAWLDELAAIAPVSVVPGNHDSYVPSAHTAIRHQWAPYMRGDAESGDAAFPYVRRLGEVGLIGVSTAVPSPPLMATGRMGADQAASLAGLPRQTGTDGLFRLILIHHPPDAGANPWHKQMTDAENFRGIIAAEGAELILHGHNHRNRRATIAGPAGEVPVIGIAATAARPREDRDGGSWNLITIDRQASGWAVEITTRGYARSDRIEDLGGVRLAA